MQLDRMSIIVLIELFKSKDSLFLYGLHRKYRLTPGQIVRTLTKLEKLKLIEYDTQFASITDKGRELIYKSRRVLTEKKTMPWRECPEEFKQPQMDMSKPYIPNLQTIDPQIKKEFVIEKL